MRSFLLGTIFLCTFILNAQNKTIDSLKVSLGSCKEDTVKVKTLNSLAENFNSAFKPDSAIAYTDIAIALAQKTKYKKGQGMALSLKAMAYFNKGNMTEALKNYATAAKLLEESGDKDKLAAVLLNTGIVNVRAGNYPAAREKLEAGLKIYKERNNKQGIANAYSNLGSIDVGQANYKSASSYFELAQKMHEELNNKTGVANCLNNIGLMEQYQGNYNNALAKHMASLKIREEIGDKNGQAMSRLNLGILNYYKSEYPQAKKEFNQCIKTAEITGNKTILSNALNNLANVHNDLGDFTSALNTFSVVLKMKQEINDKLGLGQAYLGIGNTYLKQNKYREALNYFNQSLKIHTEMGDLKNVANAYNNIGIAYQFQGNYPLALQNYNQSLKIKQQINDKGGVVQSYNNIGTAYYHQKNYPEAIKNFDLGLKASEELGDKKGMSVNHNNTGMVFMEKGDYENALRHYKLAFSIKQEIGDKEGIGLTHVNIGDIYRQQKNYPEALASFSEALKIAYDIGEKQLISSSETNIGIVKMETGDLNEARKHGYNAAKIGKEVGMPELIKKSYGLLSKISLKENNLAEAEQNMMEVLNVCNRGVAVNFPVMSEKEQENYFNSLLPEFMAFNSLALRSKEKNPAITEAVYNSAVRNKGLLLKSSSAMRNSILNSKDTLLISKYQDWITLKKQIAKLYSDGKEADDLEERSNQLEKDLVKSSQVFSSFDKAQKITWKNVQEGLKKGEAAVEFIHFTAETSNSTETIYCALIVKPESKHPEMIRLCSAKDLESLMGTNKETGFGYINALYGTNNNPNTHLYSLIWEPLEKSLNGCKTLYISPSGLLHKISFSSLCKSKNVYLCDNYKLNVQSSTGKVAFPEQFIFDEKKSVAVFGGVNYENEKAASDTNSFLTWNYLPGTFSEVTSITSTLKKNKINTELYKGREATESEFKSVASFNSILHIATHGFFFEDQEEEENTSGETIGDTVTRGASRGVEYGFGVWSFVMNKNPLMRSGLVFAGANGVWNQAEQTEEEDGVLTAQEVANLDMRQTGLVVLSACETGLGDIKGSEGVYGLQRSFKMAGAKYIIMSLWQVPDAETEEFMILFYKKLVEVKDVKKAFSDSQMAMRKKYDPFFWAPFVLIE